MIITLIGAGNVGFHLGKRLFKKGVVINQVYSRTRANAEQLAKIISAKPTDSIAAIQATADLYIIAVKDSAIDTVVAQLSENEGFSDKLVVHTSGAASSQLIKTYFKNYGVFYPLQTFSKTRKIAFSTIPICIYSNTKKNEKALLQLGRKISKKIAIVSDEDRAILHVAAVFVNNFSNHLFHVGKNIVDSEAIDFELLKPLIKETVRKIEHHTPLEMQTGPARRNDPNTLEKHLNYLQKFPDYAQLYALLTKSIQDAYRR